VSADVSVVIPSRDRPEGLARLLAGLRRQTVAPGRFEVIIVDDGSSVPVAVDPDGLHLRVLRRERSGGPAAARNVGWRAANAKTVAFIDDDCVPSERWLEALIEATHGEEVIVQGKVAPLPEQLELRHPLSHTIEVDGLSPLFISANIAYPRSLLERVGGFDESFTRGAGEDAELGARATHAGAVARFSPDALVYHEVRDRSLAEHIRHTVKWIDAVGALARHPELRSLLTLRVFWKPTHPWLLVACVALLVRRRGIAAIALARYLLHYRRLYGDDAVALARALPTHLIIDLVEIGTAVAGSVRHGTLML
jgi:glycosyltransferase involved in cell wall biosynthesis